MLLLDVKPKWNINGIVEEIAGYGDVDAEWMPTILETLDMQSEELRNRLVVINEENGCDERNQ